MSLHNFKSFGDVTLDLNGKAQSIKSHAFIYGENGSGKSSLIDALFLLMAVSGKYVSYKEDKDPKTDAEIDDAPRQLAKRMRMIDAEGNMSIDLKVKTKGSDARYFIEFDADGNIVNETLESRLNSRKGLLYKIEKGESPYLSRDLIKDKRLRDDIRSELSQYWGNRSFIRILNKDIEKSNSTFVAENINGNLLDFLRWMDSTVIDSKSFSIMTRSLPLPNGILRAEYERHLDRVEEVLSSLLTRLCSDVTGAFFEKKRKDDAIEYKLVIRRRIYGKIREVPAEFESTGTMRMMYVMSALLSCVEGRTVFIDEIDSGIHDLLMTSVMEQAIPEIKGQLVATTHNTCLMDALSAENVYVIGIDRDGFKEIRCVSSIERIRKKNSIRHKYYEGNFLGIPYVADLGLSELSDEGEI